MCDTIKLNNITREGLYELVWSKPVSKILKEYPITTSKFKKICNDYDIPLPKNGYWQKLKHNIKVKKQPLPIRDNVSENISLSAGIETISELNMLIREIKNDKTLPLIVPENFCKTDKIIVKTKKYYKAISKRSSYRKIDLPSDDVFTIMVSDDLSKRAYLFADTLIKLVRARGHDIKVVTNHQYYNYNGTKLIIFDEYYDIRIREPNIRVMEKHPTYDWKEAKYYPSGKLSLQLMDLHGYTWTDSKNILLENKLANILAYFELRAKREKKERIEREIWRKEYQRQKEIEEEIKLKREKELEAFKAVISHSSRWQKSMDLRNYINTVESNAIKNGKLNDELKTWLQWIKDKADWYDPLIEKEDEIFEKVDRDTLTTKR